jgi:hypothetical protein
VFDEVTAVVLAAGEVAAGDGLLAGEELDSVGAVGVEVAEEAGLPAREGEEGDGSGDTDRYLDIAPPEFAALATRQLSRRAKTPA